MTRVETIVPVPVRRFLRSCAAWLLALGTLGALPACVGYNNIEPIEGASGFTDPNSPPVPTAMSTALRWVVDRYPPTDEGFTGTTTEAPLAVSFPLRTRPEIAGLVLSQSEIPNAQALTQATESWPVYRIGRVWVRGDMATVDVFRPVPRLAKDVDGKPYYQCVTVNLRSGLSPWRIVSHRVWSVGSVDVPLANYMNAGGSGVVPEAAAAASEPAAQ